MVEKDHVLQGFKDLLPLKNQVPPQIFVEVPFHQLGEDQQSMQDHLSILLEKKLGNFIFIEREKGVHYL